MAWSTGTFQQLINVLHQASLIVSYPSILEVVQTLASKSIENARKIVAGPHCYQYDNINISTSIFVEQVPGTMSKVQSGTFSIIYQLPTTVPVKSMKLALMMLRFQWDPKPLTMSDL